MGVVKWPKTRVPLIDHRVQSEEPTLIGPKSAVPMVACEVLGPIVGLFSNEIYSSDIILSTHAVTQPTV